MLSRCPAPQATTKRLYLWMTFPVMLGFPSIFFSVPPLMIPIPATLPFCVQISPPVVGLMAAFALIMDRSIQPRLRFLDRMLAIASVIGVRSRHRGKHKKRTRHHRRHCCVSQSSNQDFLLSISISIAARPMVTIKHPFANPSSP